MVEDLGFGVGRPFKTGGHDTRLALLVVFVFLSLQKSLIEKPLPGDPHRASIEKITLNE
jgi:hypothetical protein